MTSIHYDYNALDWSEPYDCSGEVGAAGSWWTRALTDDGREIVVVGCATEGFCASVSWRDLSKEPANFRHIPIAAAKRLWPILFPETAHSDDMPAAPTRGAQ